MPSIKLDICTSGLSFGLKVFWGLAIDQDL